MSIREHLEDAGGAVGTVATWLVVIALAFGVVSGLHGYLWGEQEGVVRTSDCRNRILIKEDSSETWFKKFTCEYTRADSGKISGGTCAYVETNGPVCNAAYVYEKKAEAH